MKHCKVSYNTFQFGGQTADMSRCVEGDFWRTFERLTKLSLRDYRNENYECDSATIILIDQSGNEFTGRVVSSCNGDFYDIWWEPATL